MSEPFPAPDDLAFIAAASQEELSGIFESLDNETAIRIANHLDHHFRIHAHTGQMPPDGDWRVWLIMAGRGFGKTRAGAEWVRAVAETTPEARIALIGATLADARSIMVEGESGIIACCAPGARPSFEPSLRRLRFPNGAEATLFSAGEPENLRGPQFSHAWCDEIGKWGVGEAENAWDNLLLGLRLGNRPQAIATTTPRAVPLVRRLVGQESKSVAVTRGSTFDNAGNLPDAYLSAVSAEFGDSLLARQELRGEMIEDIDGALWNRSLLERSRGIAPATTWRRIVIGVDPPASANGDACGIIVAALGDDGLGHVLADCSVEKPTPEQWARAVALASQQWEADRVIAEANQGGAMVESVLRAADVAMPVKLVHASRGKSARAEPVAALYETGRVRHAGCFAKLEDELCGLMAGGEYQGPEHSPDRADALVWALTELMLGKHAVPRVMNI